MLTTHRHLCSFPAWSLFPMLPCAFPARSLFPMLPCAFPTGKCFLACSCFPIALRIGTSAGSCFPMLPQRLPLEHLPRSSFRTAATRGAVTSSAQTSASLHPPAALRLRVLPFTRAWTPTVCAEEFPSPLEMSLHGLHMSTGLLLLRHSKSIGPSAPIAYATSVSSPDEAVAWPGAAFLQITARTNPCSRHLWGTLARAVASI